VEDKGKVWYVAPNETVRYEVSTNNSLNLFRKVSLGITNKDLDKIPLVDSAAPVTPIAQRLVGRFLLQVENRGQTWFVDQLGYKHRVTSENN
jgi:CYTH domain-containing protein